MAKRNDLIELAKRGDLYEMDTPAQRNNLKLTPKLEQAIRIYAVSVMPIKDIAKACKISVVRLSQAINSPAGEHLLASLRGDLDRRFQGMYADVLDTLDAGVKHREPGVALAAASLWFKYAKSQKVEVVLTAEDLIEQIREGRHED